MFRKDEPSECEDDLNDMLCGDSQGEECYEQEEEDEVSGALLD